MQIGVCRRRALTVDACALTQRFDGLVPDVVAEFAQLGLCLGVVEQYLGVTHDGQRVVGNRCRLVCLVVDVELDDLVAGQRHREIGGCRGRNAAHQLRVARRDDALRETVIAVFDFGRELLAGRRVARTVQVEVGLHEILVERPALSVAARRVTPRQVVERGHADAHLACPDHLGRVDGLLREEFPVLGLDVGGVVHDAVYAGRHQFLTCLGAFAQEFLRSLLVFPRLARRRVYRMVFAVGAFEQADAGLVGQGDVPVDAGAVDPVRRRVAVLAGEVQVFEHALHDVFTAVARFVERHHVFGVDRFVVPGYGTEGLDLLEILPCAPETGCAFVVVVGSFGEPLRLAHVHQEIVDVVDRRPVTDRPAALQVGCPRSVGQERERLFGSHDVRVSVAVTQVCCAGGVFLDEPVDIGQQRAFVREIIPGSDLGVGIPVKEILARREQETGRK